MTNKPTPAHARGRQGFTGRRYTGRASGSKLGRTYYAPSVPPGWGMRGRLRAGRGHRRQPPRVALGGVVAAPCATPRCPGRANGTPSVARPSAKPRSLAATRTRSSDPGRGRRDRRPLTEEGERAFEETAGPIEWNAPSRVVTASERFAVSTDPRGSMVRVGIDAPTGTLLAPELERPYWHNDQGERLTFQEIVSELAGANPAAAGDRHAEAIRTVARAAAHARLREEDKESRRLAPPPAGGARRSQASGRATPGSLSGKASSEQFAAGGRAGRRAPASERPEAGAVLPGPRESNARAAPPRFRGRALLRVPVCDRPTPSAQRQMICGAKLRRRDGRAALQESVENFRRGRPIRYGSDFSLQA